MHEHNSVNEKFAIIAIGSPANDYPDSEKHGFPNGIADVPVDSTH